MKIHGGRHPLYRKEWLREQDERGIEMGEEKGGLGVDSRSMSSL